MNIIKYIYSIMIEYAIIFLLYNISIFIILYKLSLIIDKTHRRCIYYVDYNKNLQEDNKYLNKKIKILENTLLEYLKR